VFLDFSRTLATESGPRELAWRLSSSAPGRTKVMAMPIKTTAERFPGEFCLGITGDLPSMGDAVLETPNPVAPGEASLGRGYIDQVHAVRSWQITVLGLNYPVTLTMVLEDETGAVRLVHFGELNFSGWRTLVWMNPNSDRDRLAAAQPHHFVFRGFEFTRANAAATLKWTVYIHDIRMEDE